MKNNKDIVNENIKRSKRRYGDIYNKENINVQINRELIENLKKKLNGESLKNFLENLIKNTLIK